MVDLTSVLLLFSTFIMSSSWLVGSPQQLLLSLSLLPNFICFSFSSSFPVSSFLTLPLLSLTFSPLCLTSPLSHHLLPSPFISFPCPFLSLDLVTKTLMLVINSVDLSRLRC
ncbi:hypothetical protein BJ165DRAFT_1511381 [Panaeolus papilionaceus]|nr:hypothetical protein BJ165DRAFT_1511381 [Panaeolus papilionaceus]